MLTESCNNVASIFTCSFCNYDTLRKSSYDKHIMTLKHLKITSVNNSLTKCCEKDAKTSIYMCHICNKEYKSRVGLWKHKKHCIVLHLFTFQTPIFI